MARELLQNRRKYVEIMLNKGMSVYDIARFYEVRPASIVRSMNALEVNENEKQNQERIANSFFEDRNRILEDVSERDGVPINEVLKDYGFCNVPTIYAESQGLLSFQSNDPVYVGMLEGLSSKEIASKLNISALEVKRKKRSLEAELDFDLLKEESRIYKNAKELTLFVELRNSGFSNPEIAEYLFLSQNKISQLFAIAKEYDFIKDRNETISQKNEYVKYLGAEGLTQEEIVELTGVPEHKVSAMVKDLRKDTSTPMEYKNEKRRREIYNMYSQDLLTQQEIADRLGLSRATVVSDLRTYKRQHPSEVDKTYLWRQRNIAEGVKAVRIDKKEKVLALKKAGLSISAIARTTGISASVTTKYIKEEGIETRTAGNITIDNRRNLISSLLRSGMTVKDVSQELGLPIEKVNKDIEAIERNRQSRKRRAEELNMSWNGVPTTQIMALVGRSRVSVLNDQHKTANLLRNNDEALKLVTEKGGDIRDEAEDFFMK